MHDLGDVANMDVLLYGLERLRSVLLWSVNTSVQSIIQLTIGAIDSHIANIFSTADTEYINMLIDLRNSIIENGVGLDKVANLPLAVISDDEDKREDKDFLDDNTVIVHTDHDKYVATQVLSYIKEKLYSELITRVDTAIDYKTTEYETNALGMTTAIDVPIGMSIDRIMKEDEELTPKILDRLGQGTTFILYPLATSLAKYPRVDKTVYPSDKDTSVYWAITKIAEVPDGKGSVLLGTNMSTGELYGARLRVNNVGAVSISWDPFIWDNVPKVEYDPVTGKPIYNEVLPFAALFREHINDFNNPHKVRKIQTQLGLVENLPVATKSDIISRSGARKYITYDMLLLYAKAFLTGEKDCREIDEDDPTAEDYQMIFAPCGYCGDLDEIKVPTCPEENQLLLEFCAENGNKIGLYTDGNCGTYQKVIEANSAECTKQYRKPFTLGWKQVQYKIYEVKIPLCTITCTSHKTNLMCTITCENIDFNTSPCTITCDYEVDLKCTITCEYEHELKCTITCTYDINLVPKDNVIVTSKVYPIYISDGIECDNELPLVRWFPVIKFDDKVRLNNYSIQDGTKPIQYSLKNLVAPIEKVAVYNYSVIDGKCITQLNLKSTTMPPDKVRVHNYSIIGGYTEIEQALVNYPRYEDDKIKVNNYAIISGESVND